MTYVFFFFSGYICTKGMGKSHHAPKEMNLDITTITERRMLRKERRRSNKKLFLKTSDENSVKKSNAGTTEHVIRLPNNRKDSYQQYFEIGDIKAISINKQRDGAERMKIILNKFDKSALDWFWNCLRYNFFPNQDLFIKLFPNMKEITESVSIFLTIESIIRRSQPIRPWKHVGIVVVGDGSTPRSGSLFANFTCKDTSWVYSVDPMMQTKWLFSLSNVDVNAVQLSYECYPHLFVEKSKIEDVQFQMWQWDKIQTFIVIALHSHVGFPAYLSSLLKYANNKKIIVLSVPCCIPLQLNSEECMALELTQTMKKESFDMLTPKRMTYVYESK
jgi:hypothetical protein